MTSIQPAGLTDRGSLWKDDAVVFPYVLEDARVELSLLHEWSTQQQQTNTTTKGARVLIPCSSGDTAIALAASPHTSHIDAVDINIGQVHCAHLKRAAFIHFTDIKQFISFFANPFNIPVADDDTQAFRKQQLTLLLATLSAATQSYWNESTRYTAFITNGLYSFGFRQKAASNLTNKLDEIGLNPFSSSKPVSLSAENKAIWRQTWSDIVLAHIPSKPGGRYADLLFDTITNNTHGGKDNWFIRSWFGIHTTENPQSLPLYLSLHNSPLLQDKAIDLKTKINFDLFEISSQLTFSSNQGLFYDLIHVSTILDGVDPAFRHTLLTCIVSALSENGIALFRTGPFPVDLNTNERGLREIVGKYLEVDEKSSDEARERESCLIYFDVVVARKKKSNE